MKTNNNLYEEYKQVESEKDFIREKIGGYLTIISVAENEEERTSAIKNIELLVIEYAEKSKIIKELHNKYMKQLEEK